MEISSTSEFEIEDPAFSYNQDYEMSPLGNYLLDDFNFVETILNTPTTPSDRQSLSCQIGYQPQNDSPSTETTQSSIDEQRPVKQQKTNSWCRFTQELRNPKPSRIISFGNSNPSVDSSQDCRIEMPNNWQVKRGDAAPTRNPVHSLDHVLAEKKRREKLSQRFIALSAVIPGLKKTDKASILGEALKYLKQLEERVKKLQEQAARQSIESAVILRKSQVYVNDDDSSSTDEDPNGCCHQPLPDIDARVSNKEVLIRIHCENQKGGLLDILNQIEKLGLSVINSQVLPFGNSTLNVTIVAQMEADYCLTVKDLVRNLRQFILRT